MRIPSRSLPPLNQRPTDEQLSGLKALLATGRAPYVDFAVFGPFDEVEAKRRKFTEQVFVDGALQTRLLHGPSSFAAWESCWKVFRAAMVMMDQASVGALDAYADGIRQLVVTYNEWGCISRADVTMRSVQWSIVKEELDRNTPHGYNTAKPWGWVLQKTAFGVEGPRAHSWWLSVVGPLSSGASSSSTGLALAKVERLEGRVPEYMPSKRQAGGNGNPLPRPLAPRSGGGKAKGSTKKKSAEICYDWNNGGCADGPCPNGRQHACRICRGPHRGNGCTKNTNKGSAAGKKGGKGSKA